MTLNPFQRFLGLEESSDSMTLLGLSSNRCTPVQIEGALRERLAMIYQHPDGRSKDAERVRQALRLVADELKRKAMKSEPADTRATVSASGGAVAKSGSSRPSSHVFNLTAFDRLVLAVLVAYGGWNAESRTRLVALASAQGVTVHGLMRVVQGLGEYARSGGPRLGVREITADRTRPFYKPPPESGIGAGSALFERLAENLSDELKRDGAWPTIKLSMLFGLVTLLAFIIAMRIMLAPKESATVGSSDATSGLVGQVQPKDEHSGVDGASPASAPQQPRIVVFQGQPTFLGNGLPPEAVDAADQSQALAEQIDELSRKLIVADKPSEAIFRHWDIAIETAATGWVLTDASSRAQIDRAIFESLRAAADTPTVSDRLLKVLTPLERLADPLEIWRGVWRAGMLGQISGSDTLPPVIVQQARSQWESASARKLENDLNFDVAALRWLDLQVPELVQAIEIDDRTYDYWELWITALRTLSPGGGDERDAILMHALIQVLETPADLSQPGPSVNVLGRLLGIALDRPSAVVRQNVEQLFDSPNITSRDLWVFTSLLAMSDAAPWFGDELVLPDDADQRHRWRVRDEIGKSWPSSAASDDSETAVKLVVDPAVSGLWSSLLHTLLQQPLERNIEKAMVQLIAMSRLNEAAEALAAQDVEQAAQVIDELERWLQSGAPTTSSAKGQRSSKQARVGQPIGRDGEFTVAYQQIGKNIDERVELLRSLRATAGTDLGPDDAQLFVHEAYRGTPHEIRSAALSVVAQQFARGPNVAMEMLDQFVDAPANDAVSETIQSITGTAPPEVRTSTWTAAARLALVQHAQGFRNEELSGIDELTALLLESCSRRLTRMKHDAESLNTVQTPQRAAQLLMQRWLEKSAAVVPDTPVPDDLTGLQRRHATRLRLAEGAIQRFVAHQLAILDLLAYITTAEQPDAVGVRNRALELLRTSADRRARLGTVLEQAVEVERAIARMWELRMDIPPPSATPVPSDPLAPVESAPTTQEETP